MSRDGRLSVGVIGAGRVGPVLGAAFAGAGHRLVGITAGDHDRIEAILPEVAILEPQEILADSDLVVLAVPHDELPGLVSGLAALGAWRTGQLVLHTNPHHGIGVLSPAAEHGAIPLAVHPAMVFTGTTMDLRQLSDAFAGVTAPAAVLPIAQALAVELGCEPVVIAEEHRAAYGEAIDTATSFSASIIRQAAALLTEAGVDAPERYLSTLVHSTIESALQQAGGADPLTAPALEE